MRRLFLGLTGVLAIGALIAYAQVVPAPGPPTAIACAYNTAPPTGASGNALWVQCNANGELLIAGSGGSADTNISEVGGTAVPTAGADGGSNTANGITAYSRNLIFNGTTWDRQRGDTSGTYTVSGSSGSASVAITPVVTAAAANNLVLKASAGNLYSAYATNVTATAGFLLVINATTAPADGAVTPLECVPLPASGNASISYSPGPAARFSTGIVAVVSSGANCFTKTTGVVTAFIKGMVQ